MTGDGRRKMGKRELLPLNLFLRVVFKDGSEIFKLFGTAVLLAVVLTTASLCSSQKRGNQSIASTTPAPPSIEKMVQDTQTSIVQIDVLALPPREFSDPELRDWFRAGNMLTVGTGFIINSRGDIVTADHVMTELQGVLNRLKAENIKGFAEIGILQQNAEGSIRSEASGNVFMVPLVVKIEDVVHDIAVLSPASGNIFETHPLFKTPGIPFVVPEIKPTVARISVQRPTDGDSVFTCGFPLRSRTMVTTWGHVASAWSTSVLKNEGDNETDEGRDLDAELIDVYTLDLRVDHGDSGSPVLSSKDQTVIGMIVETRGSLAKAVPSKYIAALLDSNHIPWTYTNTIDK